MKKQKHNLIKDLAGQLSHEVDQNLPIKPLPNGSIAYKTYIIKETANGYWRLYNTTNKTLIDQFFLKTCALMAAKAYDSANIAKYIEVKYLDNKYWASYSDTLVYRNNIKKTKNTERYLILLNKLENSDSLAAHFRIKISNMFKWSFV
jgi:hypothetical protein